MKEKDVKTGMKVVPHSKTVFEDDSLSQSNIWSWAKRMNQPYLYVKGTLTKKEKKYMLPISKPVYKLTNVIDSQSGSDYFHAEDFDPYIEPTDDKKNE